MREQVALEQCVFLGHVDPNKDWTGNPLVKEWGGEPSATWPYGEAPHMRVVGTTGGGKSSLLRMLVRGLVRRPGPRAITIIDAEGAGEFTVFEQMPGIASVVNVNPAADRKLDPGQPSSVTQAAQAIADHLTLAVERQEQMRQAQQAWQRLLVDPAHTRPPAYVPPAEVFLVIDGWASLCHALVRYHRAKLDPVEDATLIGINGRKVDVHLVIADQVTYAQRSKDDAGMPSRLKKQLNCSVAAVGRLGLTATEASMAFDDPNAGHAVPKEPGGCLMQVGATRVGFVVPEWLNATAAYAPGVTVDQRRAAYRLLPSPEAVA